MPDREKVIRHFQDAIEASGNNNKWRFVRLDIIEDAIKLLKEQEPVEYNSRKGVNGFTVVWTCGNCGADLQPNSRRARFCSKCGRAVKWE